MDAKVFVENLISNFHIYTNIDDVTFEKCKIEPYTFLENEHYFGEKDCLMYSTDISIFNVKFTLKFLSFVYTTHAEILKLDIGLLNNLLENEVGRCRNFLQRKRNLNQTMDILVKIARLYETRRLICQTIFQKQAHVTVSNTEEGVTVKCHNHDSSIKFLEVSWSISWNVDDCEITDFIEFYCNYLVLEKECGKEVKRKLDALLKIGLSFQTQLKLWKSLMADLYPQRHYPHTDPDSSCSGQDSVTVFEISDSDSEDDIRDVTHGMVSQRHQQQIKDEIFVID